MKKSLLHASCRFFNQRLLFCGYLLLSSFITTAQVSLVKDIHWYNYDVYASEFQNMTKFQNNLYFTFRNELWRSDGTKEGTSLVRTFDQLQSLKVAGGILYVVAGEEASGIELWKTDGTAEGTSLVKDIYAGVSHSGISQLTEYNGQLLFTATDGYTGIELWKSNGTTAGTTLVKDILRVAGSSKPQNFVQMNGYLYFRANDGSKGYELWRTDGTSAGTSMLVDIYPGDKKGSNPEDIVNANGTLYFFAIDGVNGKQLWKSNGEPGNATMVTTTQFGGTPNLDWLTAVGNIVCFQANDGIHGTEIWRSDGNAAGTYLLKDITPGPGSDTEYATPHLDDFRVSNGRLYFQAFHQGTGLWSSDGTPEGTVQLTNYYEVSWPWTNTHCAPFQGTTYFTGDDWEGTGLALWKTDGTRAGTSAVKMTIGDGWDPNPMFTELNNKLYFIGRNELWTTDGTEAGTNIVTLIGPRVSSMPLHLTNIDNTLYFSATNDGYAHSLWKSDGTESGTVQVGHSYLNWIYEMADINGTLYFSGKTYHQGAELWKSDGTPAGTTQIKNIADDNFDFAGSNPTEFTAFNGETFFSAALRDRSSDLWKTDGTEAGTVLIDGEPEAHPFGSPRNLTVSGNKLYFVADGNQGTELWVTDGTKEGMGLARDIKVNYRGSNPINLTAYNNLLYFQADNGGSGYELWKSDGTAAGTSMVKDFRTGDLGSGDVLAPVDMGNMMVMNGSLYLTAIRSTGKNAIWKSDGTNAGTRVVKEFAGQPESDLLGVIGNTLIYVLKYENHLEIWKTDGTTTGTLLVESVSELKTLVKPYVAEVTDDVIYFIANTNVSHEIWRTDGTNAGTYKIVFNGNAHDLELAGNRVYVSGSTEDYGWELYVINETASSGRINVASEDINAPIFTEEEIVVSSYPNPFTEHLSIRVNGNETEHFQLRVIGMNGAAVENKELAYNQDHTLGSNWKTGFYILQIQTDKKQFAEKIIKVSP